MPNDPDYLLCNNPNDSSPSSDGSDRDDIDVTSIERDGLFSANNTNDDKEIELTEQEIFNTFAKKIHSPTSRKEEIEEAIEFIEESIKLSTESNPQLISQKKWRKTHNLNQWSRVMTWLTNEKFIERAGLRMPAMCRAPYRCLANIRDELYAMRNAGYPARKTNTQEANKPQQDKPRDLAALYKLLEETPDTPVTPLAKKTGTTPKNKRKNSDDAFSDRDHVSPSTQPAVKPVTSPSNRVSSPRKSTNASTSPRRRDYEVPTGEATAAKKAKLEAAEVSDYNEHDDAVDVNEPLQSLNIYDPKHCTFNFWRFYE
eukprot:GEZU01029466.1.p1 GENE.GEZU01029466.1~~GEZU01029466.1.p1  ORF type:complete len:314 (-),score=71.44 GEZU01029466.1:205-1146(-)